MFFSRLLTFVTIVSVAASASAAAVTSANTHFQVDCVKQSSSGVHTECHVDGHIRTDVHGTKLAAGVPSLFDACSCLSDAELPLDQDENAFGILELNGEADQEFLAAEEGLILGVDAVAKTNAGAVMQTRTIWEGTACQNFRGAATRLDILVVQAGARLVVYNRAGCTGLQQFFTTTGPKVIMGWQGLSWNVLPA